MNPDKKPTPWPTRGRMRVVGKRRRILIRNPWPTRADIRAAQELSTLMDAVERFVRGKAKERRAHVRHLERVRARSIRRSGGRNG